MRRRCVLALVLAGCLEPSLQPCGDKLCDKDAICLPSGSCAPADYVKECATKQEGDPCTTMVFAGSCIGGVCTAASCGDHIVSGSEQCDGSPGNVQCADYGFDLGVPACSERCSLDVVNTCERFGWVRVLDVPVYRAWANTTSLAIILGDQSAVRIYHGDQIVQERTGDRAYTYITGTGDTIAVLGLGNELAVSTAGGPFMPIPAGNLPVDLDFVAVSDTGELYGAYWNDVGMRLFHYDGGTSWTQILQSTDSTQVVKWLAGALYIGHDSGAVERYDGTSFTHVADLGFKIRDIAERAGTLYVTLDDANLVMINGSTVTRRTMAPALQVVATATSLFTGGDRTGVTSMSGTIGESMLGPLHGYLLTDGVDLFQYGNGVYRFTGRAYAERASLNLPPLDATMLADGSYALATQDGVITPRNVYLDGYDYAATGLSQHAIAVAGPSMGLMYVSDGNALRSVTDTTSTAIALPITGGVVTDLAYEPTQQQLYVVGQANLALRWNGTSWTTLAPPAGAGSCDLHELALRGTQAYVVGTCAGAGVVWSLGGTTWTEIHRGTQPLVGLTVDANDDVFAVGLQGGAFRVSGTWSDEPSARGTSVAATAASDVWVGGGPDNVVHWDGAHWSRLNVIGAASPHVVALPRALLIAGAAQAVLIR